MSRLLALCSDQSAVYRRDLVEVIVRLAEMPLGRKPRRQESALYLHLLVDSDVHLPVFRSLDLHRPDNYRNIGITVKSPAVKTRYRLIATVDYRVARRPCGRPALSELGVKVSFHPAQALRTPL